MFARYLIGPAVQLPHQNLMTEVDHERLLALVASDAPSSGAQSGRRTPMTLNRIVHAAHVLLTSFATGVLGTGAQADREPLMRFLEPVSHLADDHRRGPGSPVMADRRARNHF